MDNGEYITLSSVTDNLLLIREFDRIKQRIMQIWGTEECRKYMIGLVLDERDRHISQVQGFPPHIVSALLNLIDLHDCEYPDFAPSGKL